MYLEHFQLSKRAFCTTVNTEFYCCLPSHNDTLRMLKFTLPQGEGFIKITGEVGTGKTMLCRIVLNSLKDPYVCVYIPNPDLSASGLRLAIAEELGIISSSDKVDAYYMDTLWSKISHKLVDLYSDQKKVVLLIDEAQGLSDECLETIRLLSNLETERSKLVQIILFGQPELDQKLQQHHLRQLNQRITFSSKLTKLNRDEADIYLQHRLIKAGYTGKALFSNKALDILYKSSGGIPRLLNILCHKAMLVAYIRGERNITPQTMQIAVDNEEQPAQLSSEFLRYLGLFAGLVSAIAIAIYIYYWRGGVF